MRKTTLSLRAFLTATMAIYVLVCVGGCATIVGGGGSERIRLTSNPSGATVRVYDSSGLLVLETKTPTSVTLDRGDGYFRKQTYRVEFERNGAKDSVNIEARLNGWYVGNILIGGIIGFLIVDPITGAMWDLSPDRIVADLRK